MARLVRHSASGSYISAVSAAFAATDGGCSMAARTAVDQNTAWAMSACQICNNPKVGCMGTGGVAWRGGTHGVPQPFSAKMTGVTGGATYVGG